MFVVGLPVFVDVSSNGNSQHDKGLRVQMGTVHRFDVYIYTHMYVHGKLKLSSSTRNPKRRKP